MGRFRALPARALPALLCAALALCMLHSAHAYVGVVRGWGINNWNQIAIPGYLGTVKGVAAGAYHSCAVDVSGNVTCWGAQNDGRSTVPGDLGPVTVVSAGDAHTCAVKTSGNVSCWGSGSLGRTAKPADQN